MNKKYLFLYTVGPVQSYIEQSRKTHDLYAGSRILSEFTECVIEEIIKKNGANEIVFPYYRKNGGEISYPNRCVSIVETDDINNFGEYIDSKVKQSFSSKLNLTISSDKEAICKRQVEQHLKTFWSAVLYDEKRNYKEQYFNLEKTMGSIKNIRAFEQIDEGIGKRCNMCGEQRAVIFKDSRNKYLLKNNEGLCTVCYLKRAYLKNEKNIFPCTASVSLANWLEFIKNDEELDKIYKQYINLFPKNSYNEQFLYRHNITKSIFKNENIDLKYIKLNKIKNKLETLLRETQKRAKINEDNLKCTPIRQRKYYALVAFDGDSMGKWIAGEYFRKDVDFKQAQKTISKYLGEYADWVKANLKITNQSLFGSVVYAGGEDFLGFMPLENLLDTLKELRKQFKIMISDKLIDFKEENKEFTFSAGVCIAHYKTPLSHVISSARKMEKNAKKNSDNKDAIAISVIKRSGEINNSVFRWRNSEGKYLLDDMKFIKEQIGSEVFSDTFIRKIDRELYDMSYGLKKEKEKKTMRKYKNMIISELNRLIDRSCLVEEKKLEIITDMKNTISNIYNNLEEQDSNLENFVSYLKIAEFLGREPNED